ncbi:hypothetical protein KO494_08965 [Lacinutrix sp. C3R15]|uniref:hypothetical protein n=1 Tax=Flavobacteriaceae TaxID=49546 RepID=UPI001C08CC10|nr:MULTISPECIES: hypothetical protein [Flavobacteriaceae]MBU2939667.1 hypothetical protein [Lacinutrix sp. C3R15]MDO6622982.1 hypothetical protein [Oceanihabitans sp. 1_MG-2023]
MNLINKYSKFIPYLYYLTIIAYWFTYINKSEGLSAYPILLFGIPFILQILKPNKRLNFGLGITFVCLSSYMIIAYVSDFLQIIQFSNATKQLLVNSGLIAVANFIMALWIMRNSMKKSF